CQAEDGIRDDLVTGVQTCALPILRGGCRVVIAHFRNSDDGNTFAAERAELARRDGLRHHVRRVSEAVDVRVQPPTPPATLEPEKIGRASCRERVDVDKVEEW